MAKLIYSAIMSLDGYIEDKDGKFDWAVPDEEVRLRVEVARRRGHTIVDPSAYAYDDGTAVPAVARRLR